MSSNSERNRRLREEYQWYKSHGICVKCHQEDAIEGRIYCAYCRAYQRIFYRYHKPKKEETSEHREKRIAYLKAYNAKRYRESKENHKCIRCGKSLPQGTTGTRCEWCRIKENNQHNEREHRKGVMPRYLMGNGVYCQICAKPIEKAGEKLCDRCYKNSCVNVSKARKKLPKDVYARRLINYWWENHLI